MTITQIDERINELRELKKVLTRDNKVSKAKIKKVRQDFAKRLKGMRGYYGFTMQELADEIGVTRQTIHKWESGLKLLSYERMNQLKRVLN